MAQAAPYAMEMEHLGQQAHTYILPLPGQQDDTLWATFTQVLDMHLEMDELAYCDRIGELHHWQVTHWQVWAGGVRVGIMPTVPGGLQRHYNMVLDHADGAYLAAR